MAVYPGTTVEKKKASGKEFLSGMFMAKGGLVLQQIKEITGIKAPTIQNWVNRGFIPHPVNKRYSKDATARIFIINALRDIMNLEDIKKLLIYVNGNPESRVDDIIPESVLYSYFCDIVFNENFSFRHVNELIDGVLVNYKEKYPNATIRLKFALEIICINYLANNLLQRSKCVLDTLEQKNIFGEEF